MRAGLVGGRGAELRGALAGDALEHAGEVCGVVVAKGVGDLGHVVAGFDE